MERPIQGSLTKLFLLLLMSKALGHFPEFLAVARASSTALLGSVALFSIPQEVTNKHD
jgi:hypothetical protein